MNIQLDEQIIIDLVKKHIESKSFIHSTTLGQAITDEIDKMKEDLRICAAKAVSNVLSSNDFIKYIEKIIKQHMHDEAARIGKNCARAIAMDKPKCI